MRIEPRAAGFEKVYSEGVRSEARMVDLLSMFRRRPAKRGRTGFARAHDNIAADITAFGDGYGEMVPSAVRDAPPIAREVPVAGLDRAVPPQHAEVPQPQAQRPRPQLAKQAQARAPA